MAMKVPTKPKIFTIWTFKNMFADSHSEQRRKGTMIAGWETGCLLEPLLIFKMIQNWKQKLRSLASSYI